MEAQSLSLRTRLRYGFIGVGCVLLIIAIIVGAQYVFTYVGGSRLEGKLTPAAELTDTLLLAQSTASGDLSDYVLTDRKRSLAAHLDSVDQANSMIRALEATLDGDSALLGQLAGVRVAQQVWLDEDAQPTIDAMEAGDTREAARLTNLPRAWDAFDAMVAATTDFRDEIESQRNQSRDRVNAFASQLGLWLALLAVALLVVVALASSTLNAWVLRPLVSIRRDLSAASRAPHTHPIANAGPPELQAVASDAEDLRRSLVDEIDEAQAARAGLAQDAPLVAEMRAAFQPVAYQPLAGVGVAGTSSSAEGVLAGDWWDAINLANGQIAIVVADTSGHGTAATITALRTRDLLRSALMNGDDAARAVQLAAVACQQGEHFVTAFTAIIDPTARTLTFANAGHLPAVLVTTDKSTLLCEPTGPLLSVLGGSWSQRTLPFETGDCLIAFTDGLTERRGPNGTDVDPEDVSRIIRSLDAPVRQNAAEILARILGQIRERASVWHTDDVTAVVVTRPVMAP